MTKIPRAIAIGGLLVILSAVASAAVDLAWFEARTGPRIKLEWRTGSEIDLSGFFVRRCEKPGRKSPEEYGRIEVEEKSGKRTLYISPGPDAVAGSFYERWDPDVAPGKTYYYLLEVVDNQNHSDFHGPIKAVCTRKTPRR